MSDVVLERELIVVDPHRVAVVGHPFQTLPIAGYVLELGEDVSPDSGEIDSTVLALEGGCIEQGHSSDVHMTGPGLERQERGVEVGEKLVVEFTHQTPRNLAGIVVGS